MIKTGKLLLICMLLVSGGASQALLAQKPKPPILLESQWLAFNEHYVNAVKARINNNLKEAEEHIRKALEIDPTSAAAWYELGDILIRRKQWEPAVAAFSKANELEPSKSWYTAGLANALESNGRFKEAAAAYEAYIKKYKAPEQFYQETHRLHMMSGEPDKAIAILEKQEKAFGSSLDLSLQQEQIYLRQKNYKKAHATLDRILKSDPENVMVLGMKADVFIEQGKEEEGVKLYKRILEIDPENGLAHLALFDHYRAIGNAAEAKRELTAGFANEKGDFRLKVRILQEFISRSAFEPESKKTAFELAQLLTETHPSESVGFLIYGDLLYEDQQYEEARIQYEQAIALEADNFKAWQQLLFCLNVLHEYTVMEEQSSKAMELFPAQPFFFLFNAIANNQLNAYEKALQSAEGGLNFALDNKNLRLQLLSVMGEAAHFEANYAKSDKAYQEALSIDSNYAYGLNNYAYFLSLRDTNLALAANLSGKSLKADPDNASYLDTYGWIQFKLGHFEQALTYIKSSLDKDPNNAETLEHYGDVLFHTGKTTEALEYWNKAKEKGRNTPQLESKIKNKRYIE